MKKLLIAAALSAATLAFAPTAASAQAVAHSPGNYKRGDEPDLYLITEFARIPDAKEQMDRDAAMERNMRETARQAEQASGQRVSMRRLGSNMLLQELVLKAK